MKDMKREDVRNINKELTLKYYDGSFRKVFINDKETPFPDGILIVSRTDTKGIITHCNQPFIDISGYKKEELIGENHCILRHPDMPAIAFKDLWSTISQRKKWHGYVKNLRKDGTYYWVYATAIPNIRNNKIIGYTSVRRKPSRNKISECIALYAKLLQQEKNN